MNFATELRIAYSDGIKKVLSEKPDAFDPKVYSKVGRENGERAGEKPDAGVRMPGKGINRSKFGKGSETGGGRFYFGGPAHGVWRQR